MLTQECQAWKVRCPVGLQELNGYPLKRAVELTENGQFIGKSRIEVTKIVQGPVSESVFEIPPHDKKVVVPAQ